MPGFFPYWVIVTHFLNIFFMLLLARSGVEVLSAMPKLYWHDDCPPGRQWLRLSKKNLSADSRTLWTSLEGEESWSPVIALPGRKNLGLGRHWHFLTIQFWVLTGAVYIALVFATGYWHYLLPTSWSLFPDSVRSVGAYLQFQFPRPIPGQPFEPAQKLAYFVVIFVLAPFQIATGAAMSPTVLARFPWYGKLFGGKQGARSLHFLGLCAFAAFVVVHVLMVIIHGVPRELAAMGGLVEHPVSLSLAELRHLGRQSQITKHNCIQGWTAIAEWAGVPLARVVELVQPRPEARHSNGFTMIPSRCWVARL